MKNSINYKVIGKSVKSTKTVETLCTYISNNYNVKGKRLGLSNFIKDFGKFNDEKETLLASSVVTVKDIQTACRLVATDIKENNSCSVIPCLISKNAIITIETKSIDNYETFYPTINQTKKSTKSPTEFICDYIKKHETEIDFNALQLLIDDLKA